MKHNITIILYRPELVRCIKEMAYIISKSGVMRSEEGISPEHKIADILDKEDGGTDGNDYLGTRAMNYAVATLRAAVRKHAMEPPVSAASHNEFAVPQEYRIHLTMETEAPKAMAHTLQEMMNKFVCLHTLAEWCKMLGSEKALVYQEEAEQVKQEIMGMLNPPTRHERRGWPLW